MIDVKELRVGNIIGSKTFEQWEVRPYDIEQIFDNSDKDQYFGIPITSDFLEKVSNVENCKSYHLGYEKDYKVYRIGKLTYNGIQATWWYNGQVLEDVQPEFIHTLQNLIFSLTGKELEIKP